MLSQVAATSPPATFTPAISGEATMAAMVLPASWSALPPSMGASSMPSTFSRSRLRAISSFSLKVSVPSRRVGSKASVMSISLMVFIVSLLIWRVVWCSYCRYGGRRGPEKTPRKLKREVCALGTIRTQSNRGTTRGCRVRGRSSALQQALSHGNGAAGTPYCGFQGFCSGMRLSTCAHTGSQRPPAL